MPRRSLKLSRSRSRSLLGPWLSGPRLRSTRWSRAHQLGQVGGKSLRRQRAPRGGCPRPATNMARWRVRLGRRLERIEDRPPSSSRGGRGRGRGGSRRRSDLRAGRRPGAPGGRTTQARTLPPALGHGRRLCRCRASSTTSPRRPASAAQAAAAARAAILGSYASMRAIGETAASSMSPRASTASRCGKIAR